MSEAPSQKDLRKNIKALCPLVDHIRLMLTAARHAFNLHSRAKLEEMAKIQKTFTLEIDPFFERVEKGLKKGTAAEKTDFLALQEILTHLELMANKVAGLSEHLRYKANHGAILSDQDVFTVNNLFSRLNGLLQALVDIFQINDAALKAYLLQECEKITEGWFRSETDHKAEMMDTPGRPDAWSVYLAILETSREITGHLAAIVKSLD
jgi:Na+/phosphate symporter